MKIYIRRVKGTKQPWFEVLGKSSRQLFVDFAGIKLFQKFGFEVLDIDAVRLEMSKWN